MAVILKFASSKRASVWQSGCRQAQCCNKCLHPCNGDQDSVYSYVVTHSFLTPHAHSNTTMQGMPQQQQHR